MRVLHCLDKNPQLVMGLLILIAVIGCAVFAEGLSLPDPNDHNRLWKREGIYEWAPYPPCDRYPWGSDFLGRDLRSRIIYGGRVTLPVVASIALLRLLMGIVAGAAALLPGQRALSALKRLSFLEGSLPPFLLALVILYSSRASFMEDGGSFIWIVLVSALVGWVRVASAIAHRADRLMSSPFIEAAISLGCSRWRLLRVHLLPHLIPVVLVGLVTELGRSLLLLGQLSVFGVMVYGQQLIRVSSIGTPVPFYPPEWGTLLYTATYSSPISNSWYMLIIGSAFAVTILGFLLTSQGLQRHFELKWRI